MTTAEIFAQFSDAPLLESTACGGGLINTTQTLTTPQGRYVLQRINRAVFGDVGRLTDNISAVTRHLRARGCRTIEPICTKSGALYYETPRGECYRLMRFVEGTNSYERTDNCEIIRLAGAAFGRFGRALSDFDAGSLHETIPDFHNTPQRAAAFERAVQRDAVGRAQGVADELEFLLSQCSRAGELYEPLQRGELPLRVTHNDTKLSNVLLADSLEQCCVIDLDTVMGGSLLYDYGDAVRYCAASLPEDTDRPQQMHFCDERVAAFTAGFVGEYASVLTAAERELLPSAIRLITLEQCFRFMSDYLLGDVYFKTDFELHNLRRARAQLALLRDFDARQRQLTDIIKSNSPSV